MKMMMTLISSFISLTSFRAIFFSQNASCLYLCVSFYRPFILKKIQITLSLKEITSNNNYIKLNKSRNQINQKFLNKNRKILIYKVNCITIQAKIKNIQFNKQLKRSCKRLLILSNSISPLVLRRTDSKFTQLSTFIRKNTTHLKNQHQRVIRINQNTNHCQMKKQVSLLKELQFENIIKFHRMLKTPNSIYLVYDYIPPNNLYAVIQTQVKKLAEFEKEAYLKQVCTALMHMKSKNIVHLNLHPKNIYITQDGIVKLGGFIYGQILGTQKQIQLMNIPPQSQFVAPEVLSKKVGSFFSDMYSLARIFYALQMCTEEKSLLSVGNITSSTQNQLSSLVKRMGSKNPTHRATLEQVHAYLFRRASKLRRSNSRSSNSNLAATVGSTKGSSRAGNIIKAQKSDKGGSSRNLDISNKSKSRSRSIRRSNSNAGSDIQQASSPISRSKGGTSPEQQAKQANSFKKFVCQVLRIRNFAIFLLKLSLNTACLSLGSQKSTILSYLLLKKSTIVICNLADYASNGEAEVDIKASQIQKIKFASKPDFFKVSSIINKQMNVQKKMLERIRKDIEQEYPELTKQEKFGVQLKRDALDEKYLKQSVVEYMKILISDENMLKSLDKSNLEGIFMLSQVIASESYERMFDNFIKDQEIDLQAQPLFLHIKAMDSAALVASILKKTKKLI